MESAIEVIGLVKKYGGAPVNAWSATPVSLLLSLDAAGLAALLVAGIAWLRDRKVCDAQLVVDPAFSLEKALTGSR